MISLSGQLVDIKQGRIFAGRITVANGRISGVTPLKKIPSHFILPGLIDAHVHVESSMLTPAHFARAAVVHGTVAAVSDPHEIANVLGMEGVEFMIADGKQTPFKYFFGAPSCVPATPFETAGAAIGPDEVERLLQRDDIHYLSEMMNFPGVISGDAAVLKKIAAARRLHKPVDGHAPGLTGRDLERYFAAGISTDHEAFDLDEARAKLDLGMKIQIREGSAARNFDTLIPLLKEYPDQLMFCSDDKHPDDLLKGHIDLLVRRAIAKGFDPLAVIACATRNIIEHYNLPVGLLQEGDPADFIVVDDLEHFNILATYIDGNKVAEAGRSLIATHPGTTPNNFRATPKTPADFAVKAGGSHIRVIAARDGQLITGALILPPRTENGLAVSDPARDILKIAVINRYRDSRPAVGFIRNFGLKRGAIASSVAHDSHNIIAVGVSDEDICRAVNLVIGAGGGLAAVDDDGRHELLQLPVAGIMAAADAESVAGLYAQLDVFAKQLGSKLAAPFMTLAFMALPVIPELKITDKGLFDVQIFKFTELFI